MKVAASDSNGITINGVGAAGIADAKSARRGRSERSSAATTAGAIYEGRAGLPPHNAAFAERTNRRRCSGTADELAGADVFIGLSAPGRRHAGGSARWQQDPIVFAMANPSPRSLPRAGRGGRLVATGRSDYPNQVNNSLAFPGVFRGALDVSATRSTTR